ncbi:hypothetical protein [Blastopirellula marina]|nr:hypothetical protein [Blastopirellula marina]
MNALSKAAGLSNKRATRRIVHALSLFVALGLAIGGGVWGGRISAL